MGKAYTEEEKEQIRIRLMEEGIRLFHENGSKTLSIRELTRRAGIAQGGFYSFYEDKDALIRDIISYRGTQKVHAMEEMLPASLQDPKGYLKKACCMFVLDLIRKARSNRMYADMISLGLRDKEHDRQNISYGLSKEVLDYWRQHGFTVTMDAAGFDSLLAAAFVLGRYGDCLDEAYMEQAVEMLLETGIDKYVEVSRQ